MKRAALLFFSFVAVQVRGATVTEDFSSRSQRASGTAVWNQTLGTVHPGLVVTNYTGGGAFTPVNLNVGDGVDGAFEPSRYAEFSKDGNLSGNIIRLDLVKHSELNVTSFLLESGWRLEPVGNAKLVIRSLSNVIIRGEIWCQGRNGSVSSGATGGEGGEGRCGGASGGAGGDAGGNGVSGGNSVAPVTGGKAGAFTGGPAVGGGGGGSWNTISLPGNGPNFSGTPGDPGEAGVSSSDPEFDTIAAGAGGGGGGAGPGVGDAGGGGGAGGGMVIIHAVGDFELGSSTNSNIGYIYANGGNGADSAGIGGPGAGGGGGSVQVFVGGTIRMYNTNTGFAAAQAVGGRNVAPTVGASGGSGRNWFSSISYSGTGFVDPSEQAPVVPGNNVKYVNTAQTVVSKAYDLQSTLAEVTSVVTSPSSGDFQLEWAGSTDNFSSDDTGWTTSVGALKGKRFVKFRFTMTTSSVTAPTVLDAVTFNYVSGFKQDFAFKATAGCGQIHARTGSDINEPLGTAFLLCLPFLFLIFRRSFRSRFTDF